MNTNLNIGLLLARISTASTMLLYGINKVQYGIEWLKDMLIADGLPTFIALGVYVGEILIPLMILLGIRTKIAGLIFAFNCLFAILLVHRQNIFALNEYGGWNIDLLFIYAMLGIALFFTGAGKYALSSSNKWD